MKFNSLFVAVTFFFASSVTNSAYAFSGNWVGTGKLQDSRNLFASDCTQLEIKTEKTDAKLFLHAFVYKCGLIDSDWIGLEYNIDGEKLLDPETGDSMGKILENEILIVYQSGVLETLSLKRDSNNQLSLDFNTRNALGTIQISGQLSAAAQ